MAEKPRPDPFGSIPITDNLVPPSKTKPPHPRRRGFARRMLPGRPGFFLGRRFWLYFTILAGGVYLLAGFFLVPYLCRTTLAATLATRLGRPVTIGQAAFNPLTLSLHLQNGLIGARLDHPTDPIDPLCSFSDLRLDLAPASLLRKAVIGRRLTIVHPFFHLVREEEGGYNLAGLFPLGQTPAPGNGTPALLERGGAALLYSLNNITLSQGRLLFDDRPATKSHRVEGITLALPLLANIDYQANSYLTPKFAATINGSPLELAGTTQLQEKTMTTSLALHLKKLDLANYLAYLPALAPTTVSRGSAELDCQLTFASAPGVPFQLGIEGRAHLLDLELRDSNNNPSLLPNTTISGFLEPLAHRYHFTEITVDNPQLQVEKSAGGTWLAPLANLFRMILTQPGTPTQIQIDKFRINDGNLALTDHSRPKGFSENWSRINLTVTALANPSPPAGQEEANSAGELTINAQDSHNYKWSGQGKIASSPPTLAGQLTIEHFELPRLAPYLPLPANSQISGGQADGLAAHFQLAPTEPGKAAELTLDHLNLQLRELLLGDPAQPRLKLPHLTIRDGSITPGKNRIDLGTLSATAATINLGWNPDGSLGWPFPEQDHAPGWQTTFQMVELNECTALLPPREGNGAGHPLPFALKAIRSLTADNEATLTATGKISGDHNLTLSGPVTLHPFTAKLHLQLDPLNLESIAPLLGEWLTPTVAGTLSADGYLTLPEASFSGSAKLAQLRVGPTSAPLLSWSEAQSQTLQLDLTTLGLAAERIEIKQPVLNIALLANDANNFDRFFKNSGEDFAKAKGPSLRFSECSFADGRADFANQRLTPPFRSQLSEIAGTISNFAPTPEIAFNFSLQAKVAKEATLTLAGNTRLDQSKPILELKGKLDRQPLLPLAPYLEPHFGFKVVGGKMNLSGNYRFEGGKIASESLLHLQNLQLGAPLPSEKGGAQGRLPFTQALLENGAGHLELALLCDGEAEKASPFLAAQLQKTLRNLLLKTAVSPMAMLAESGKKTTLGEQLRFKAGESELAGKEYEKLQELARILADRPRLQLRITGSADQGVDRPPPPAKGKKGGAGKKAAQEFAPLLDLATKRGLAVKLALEKAGVPAERLLLTPEPQLTPADSFGSGGNRVDLKLEPRER